MAEYPGAARAGVSPNRSDRQGKVRLFIVHHYAGTQDPESAWNRFMSSNDRDVSPNYQVNADGSVFEVVPPDRYRAWTTGAIDHQAVTCETQNTSGAPNWGISRESHEAIARLIAWAAARYGFPIQRGRVADGDVVEVPGVVGHRETPAGRKTGTACPGPSMDLDWLVARARQIANREGTWPNINRPDRLMTADITYAPDRIGYRYGTPDSAYSKGYHRGQDVRKLNADETASVVTDVDAIDDGTVAYVGIPNGLLRRTVVIDTGRAQGRYESHSHLADINVSVGQRVASGQRIARNAAMDEGPGLVTAPHDHVTITDYLGGAWETWRNEYDPLPFMQAAYQRAKEGANDMGTLDNTEDNYQTFARFLQRALKFDVRPDGFGADWKLGPTVFELLRAADDTADVKAIAVKMTDEDRAAIAKSVADAIKIPAGGASKADVAAAIDAGLAKLVLKPATS